MMLQRDDPVFQRFFRKSWGDFFLISLSNFLVRVFRLPVLIDISSGCFIHVANFQGAKDFLTRVNSD